MESTERVASHLQQLGEMSVSGVIQQTLMLDVAQLIKFVELTFGKHT